MFAQFIVQNCIDMAQALESFYLYFSFHLVEHFHDSHFHWLCVTQSSSALVQTTQSLHRTENCKEKVKRLQPQRQDVSTQKLRIHPSIWSRASLLLSFLFNCGMCVPCIQSRADCCVITADCAAYCTHSHSRSSSSSKSLAFVSYLHLNFVGTSTLFSSKRFHIVVFLFLVSILPINFNDSNSASFNHNSLWPVSFCCVFFNCLIYSALLIFFFFIWEWRIHTRNKCSWFAHTKKKKHNRKNAKCNQTCRWQKNICMNLIG